MIRTRERYAAIQQLLRDGRTLSAICRTLRLDRKTVQRVARACSVDELLVKARNRGSLLDAFKPYLHEQFNAGHVLQHSPAPQATYDQVRGFATILTQRRGHHLDHWMRQVDMDGSPALRSFVAGLRADLTVVTAGLTLSWSSGPVEGNVNRIKMIKRQMYGRANLDLLRKRVLLAT